MITIKVIILTYSQKFKLQRKHARQAGLLRRQSQHFPGTGFWCPREQFFPASLHFSICSTKKKAQFFEKRFIFLILKGKVFRREKETKKEKIPSIYWFISQMAALSRVGPGQSQALRGDLPHGCRCPTRTWSIFCFSKNTNREYQHQKWRVRTSALSHIGCWHWRTKPHGCPFPY